MALVLLATPMPAAAQDDLAHRRATARDLFERGVRLADESEWEEAAVVFERAYQLYPSASLALNWGLALGHTGRLVAASEAFERVLRHDDASDTQRAQAEVQLERLRPRLGRLTITLDGGEPADGAQVLLDGAVVAPELIGVAVPVDPGRRTLVARRGDAVGPEVTVEIGEGEVLATSVSAPPLPVAAPTPAEAARTAATAPETAPPLAEPVAESAPVTAEPWFWAVIGAGAALVVAAVIIGVVVATSESSQPVCEELGLGCLTVP